MGLRLDQIIPWGRSLAEYISIFDLSESDLSKKILDCAGGPASFNAELTKLGGKVTSCDPIYQFSADEIEQRVQETYNIVLEKVKFNQDKFVWTMMQSPEQMAQMRINVMQKFIEDFPQGLQTGRYKIEELPKLSFDSHQFDIALCSHLLFTYSDQLSLEFHLSSIIELCRVATEVRIFPLLINITGETSPYLQPVIQELQTRNYSVNVKKVAYEFQKGGNQILQVSKANVLKFAKDQKL